MPLVTYIPDQDKMVGEEGAEVEYVVRPFTILRWLLDRHIKYQNWWISEYQRVRDGTVVRFSTISWLDQRVGEDGGEAGDVVGSLQSSTISWSGTRLSWKK